jgi:hypothetical protein
MIDVKPTWLLKLEEKCNKEKDTSSILKAQAQPSMFYSMYPAIGNNEEVINAELGQGAAGAQGVSPNNIMHGLRTIINISAHKTDKAKGKDHLTVYQEGENEYPSNFTCKTTTNDSNITNTKCITDNEQAIKNCEDTSSAEIGQCTTADCIVAALSKEKACLETADNIFHECTTNAYTGNYNLTTEECLKKYYTNNIKTENASKLQGGHGGVVITW